MHRFLLVLLILFEISFSEEIQVGYLFDFMDNVRPEHEMFGEVWTVNVLRFILDDDIELKSKLYKDVNKLKEDFKNNKIEFALIPSIFYLDLRQSNFEPLVTSETLNNDSGISYLITIDKNIKSLKDLQGKSISVYSEYRGDIHLEWLDHYIQKNHNKSMREFFKKIKYYSNNYSVITDLLINKVDSIMISSLGYHAMVSLNPSLKRKLKIIKISEKNVIAVFGIRKNYKKEMREKICNKLINLKESPYGEQLLKVLKSDKIIKVNDEDLQYLNKYRSGDNDG